MNSSKEQARIRLLQQRHERLKKLKLQRAYDRHRGNARNLMDSGTWAALGRPQIG